MINRQVHPRRDEHRRAVPRCELLPLGGSAAARATSVGSYGAQLSCIPITATSRSALDTENAPATVANFLQYVRDGHYDNTVFHRVIDGFMIQGGGFEPGMKQKPTRATGRERSRRTASRTRSYSVAMARTSEPHSATAQFFINVADNDFLDYKAPSAARLRLLRVRATSSKAPTSSTGSGRAYGHFRHASERAARGRHHHRRQGRAGVTTLRQGTERPPMKPALLLSDLHLSPARPAAVAAFHAFARGPARAASVVYILGDLFDWWLGDDQLREPFAHAVGESIRGITAAGVPVYFARGNRDFMLGEDFGRATGARLLPTRPSSTSAGRARCSCMATSFASTTSTINGIARGSAR